MFTVFRYVFPCVLMTRMASLLNVNIIETKASPLLSISLFDRGDYALQVRVIGYDYRVLDHMIMKG